MLSPEETPITEEQRRLSQNGVLNAAFIQHPPPSQNAPSLQTTSDITMIQQMLHLLQQQMAQQQQQMTQQQQLFSQLMQQREQQQPTPVTHYSELQPSAKPSNPELILEALAGNITEFHHDAEANITFESWYARYDDLFSQDASRLDDAAKVRLLGRKLGAGEYARFTNFILPRAPRDLSFSEMVEKLTVLFGKMESTLSKRYKCLSITKSRSEDLLSFTGRVNRACVDFEFASMTEEQFKCLVLVCGLKDECDRDIRVRLLASMEERTDATLAQLAEDCHRLARVKADSAMIATDTSERVHAVHAGGDKQRYQKNDERNSKPFDRSTGSKPRNPCWLCGALHWSRECTYKAHKCRDCGRIGHREGHCASSHRRTRHKKFHQRPFVATRVVRVNVCSVQQHRKFVTIQIENKSARLQLDTGSDISVISQRMWKQLGKPYLTPVTVRAKAASGDVLRLEGEFIANVSIANRTKRATIRVSKMELALLGADMVNLFALGTIPMDNFCNNIKEADPRSWEDKFPSVFHGTGICTKASVHLQLRKDARPVFRPKRPVAYAMEEIVNKELDRLEGLGIISPVDYSDWAAPVVVVRKANGQIRLCGDYSTGLNAALHPHEYPLPLPQDIFSKLARCKIFTQLDLSDAFLQVEIETGCRPLLTINTHRGLYHYNRLPPGIKVAPGAFQQIMDKMLAGINGVSAYMDDVIIGGKTQEEHDIALEETIKRIQDYGFTIRSEKCAFNKPQIRYLGHIIDSQGLRPDPLKIEAIKKLPPPKDISGVRSFIGAVNYYAKFIPSIRDLRYPMDKLLQNGNTFEWTPECQKVFERFKTVLSSDLLLTHYDPKLDIVVSADASSIGLGATLSHKFPDGSLKVVQHASRALSKAEEGYSQIDREGLAIIFALYDMTIEYIPTGSFGNADVLSRLIQNHAKPESEYIVASIELEQDLRDIELYTQQDPSLQKVYKYVRDGWPRDVAYGTDLARLYDRRESLTNVDGCILFGERVVIPEKLRNRCLNQLHRGHPGMQRMKAVARSYVYWPKLDDDIARYVASCEACAAAAKSPPRATSMAWPKPSAVWNRVHIDYAGPWEGVYFLVVVDAYSKWPEIVKTTSTTTTATITILRNLFARFGMPATLVSDNGTQFVSGPFKEFCQHNGIEHITTAPFHPQSNGQAERFVDTLKRSLRKIRTEESKLDEDLELFLMTYRSTPNAQLEQQRSPAEEMFGRPIRTALELLRPPSSCEESSPSSSISSVRRFHRSDTVWAKYFSNNSWKWIPGEIVRSCGRVMFEIVAEDGRLLRRHVNQLRRRVGNGSSPAVQLPLDVLLAEWKASSQPEGGHHVPATHSTDQSAFETSQHTAASTPPQPQQALETEHPTEGTNQQQIGVPRRSSRVRRLPRRLGAYQLN
uniref:uncharacterized protein K02A2.6-like n=1 Tax=Anopheles coluzzii TaxID=1518534 RepID=UPI0020FFE60C|nr:uncharacterized protein K02A2.6-like [Anopheles coluzzii]